MCRIWDELLCANRTRFWMQIHPAYIFTIACLTSWHQRSWRSCTLAVVWNPTTPLPLKTYPMKKKSKGQQAAAGALMSKTITVVHHKFLITTTIIHPSIHAPIHFRSSLLFLSFSLHKVHQKHSILLGMSKCKPVWSIHPSIYLKGSVGPLWPFDQWLQLWTPKEGTVFLWWSDLGATTTKRRAVWRFPFDFLDIKRKLADSSSLCFVLPCQISKRIPSLLSGFKPAI